MSFTLWRGVVGMVRPTRRPGTLEELIRLLPEGIGIVPLLLNFKAGSNAEFVVSLLAASRADLIIVPLDPALPVSDQRARIEAAGARVVLVDGNVHDQGESALNWWRVSVGTDRNNLAVHLDADTAPSQVTSAPYGLRDDDRRRLADIDIDTDLTSRGRRQRYARGNQHCNDRHLDHFVLHIGLWE